MLRATVIRSILLALLVVLGVSRPLLVLFSVQSEGLAALSLSPMIFVFSSYHFFHKIRIFYQYRDSDKEVLTRVFFDPADGLNIYRGKMRYNVVYMNQALSRRQRQEAVRLHFCDKDLAVNQEEAVEPETVEVVYENRSTGSVYRRDVYSCR